MLLSSILLGNAGVRVGVDDGHPAGDTGVDKEYEGVENHLIIFKFSNTTA